MVDCKTVSFFKCITLMAVSILWGVRNRKLMSIPPLVMFAQFCLSIVIFVPMWMLQCTDGVFIGPSSERSKERTNGTHSTCIPHSARALMNRYLRLVRSLEKWLPAAAAIRNAMLTFQFLHHQSLPHCCLCV